MLSCSCISFPRKVIILFVLLFPLIITAFRTANVCSSFSWSFVDIFTGISIFAPIFSVTSKLLSVLRLLKFSSWPSDYTSYQLTKSPIDSCFEFLSHSKHQYYCLKNLGSDPLSSAEALRSMPSMLLRSGSMRDQVFSTRTPRHGTYRCLFICQLCSVCCFRLALTDNIFLYS